MKKIKYCYTLEWYNFRNPRYINLKRNICGHRIDYREYKTYIQHLRLSVDDYRIVCDWDDIPIARNKSRSWKDKYKFKKQYEKNLTNCKYI